MDKYVIPEEKAWLVEYQGCQQLIKQHQTQYWVIFGIFFGISTAAISWLLSSMTNDTGASINNSLTIMGYNINLNVSILGQAITSNKYIITCLGISSIVIIWIFKLWLKRVAYTESLNYLRMREIELELDMWQGWRIHILDTWYEFKKTTGCSLNEVSGERWVIFRNKLQEGLSSSKYCDKLDDKKDIIIEIIRSSKEQRCFEGSFHKLHYHVLTNTIISLWLFLILFIWPICWLQWSAIILFATINFLNIIFFLLLKINPDWRKNCNFFKCLEKLGII